MKLIASYKNKGFESIADGLMSFFDRRTDLYWNGIAFTHWSRNEEETAKISTVISLLEIDGTDPKAFALFEIIIRGVNAGINK